MRVGLVGCTKSKRTVASSARDLYDPSTLFRGRRAYVERTCDRWFILSALYGLVDPDDVIEPYDVALKSASTAERRAWSRSVLESLRTELGDLRGIEFECHAGSEYLSFGVVDGLLALGATITVPTEGLSFGRQLAFYSNSTVVPPRAKATPAASAVQESRHSMTLEFSDVAPTGSFGFTWWAGGGTEHFDRGWQGNVVADGRRTSFRYGVGRRDAYGRLRVHSVTWLDGQPTAEGVEPDDYVRSRSLISLIKRPDKKLARKHADVVDAYQGFTIVDHRDEIDAPYSRRGLAVKIPTDDYEAWVRLALARVEAKNQKEAMPAQRIAPVVPLPPPPAVFPGSSPGLAAILDLERGLDIEGFAGYLRLYERETGYDRSLLELRSATGAAADPSNPHDVERLLGWLRSWGCRHLRKADESRTSATVIAWAERWLARLPEPGAGLVDLPTDTVTFAAIAFGELAESAAASRVRANKVDIVRFGPTAAAKALYAIRPNAFAPWDEPIRQALGLGENDAAYRAYLGIVARALTTLSERARAEVDELPSLLDRPNSSPPKLIDEYLWIRITRGLRPEA